MQVENTFQKIRDSCTHAVSIAQHVKINHQKVESFIQERIIKKLQSNSQYFTELMNPTSFPSMKFTSLDQEINFLVLYSLLQFGSGFRLLLHKYTGKGAGIILMNGPVNMVLSGSKIDAKTLQNFQLSDIEVLFNIPLNNELKPLIDMIVFAHNDCGRILSINGWNDFSQFIRETLSKIEKERKSANFLTMELINTFPGVYNDVGKANDGSTVYLYKKAMLTVGELFKNLRKRETIFDFEDIFEMPIYVDNVIPATLHKVGILEYSDQLENYIINNKQIIDVIQETEIRSCALIV